MQIQKIKSKPWIKTERHGVIPYGRKITIYTLETAELSILEIQKIEEFFKTLRA
jgi:hypothetical protein